jgi:hypothetical protein
MSSLNNEIHYTHFKQFVTWYIDTDWRGAYNAIKLIQILSQIYFIFHCFIFSLVIVLLLLALQTELRRIPLDDLTPPVHYQFNVHRCLLKLHTHVPHWN